MTECKREKGGAEIEPEKERNKNEVETKLKRNLHYMYADRRL